MARCLQKKKTTFEKKKKDEEEQLRTLQGTPLIHELSGGLDD